MDTKAVISPAFEAFLADSGVHDKTEAIVIYRAAAPPERRARGRLRMLRQRLEQVKTQAAAQKTVGVELLKAYQDAAAKGTKGDELETASIGRNALPVAAVQVTRKTLRALAEQPQVVGILPNQRIHLIEPKQVDYEDLAKQETNDGLTWGLKLLDIPKLWETTRGKDINVAVLDTGVHADHPALAGRVKDFLVVDPLGRRIAAQPAFDSGQHGTHVCGTIAGGKADGQVSIGVAPEANLLVAGVLMGNATIRTLLEGLDWAIEKGADIVSMSLGFSYYEPLFAHVFQLLLDQYGILPVVSIGNTNHGNSSSPGNAHSALSVGAVEKMPAGKAKVAFFSSGASLVFPGDATNSLVHKPDVVAPGVQVFSSVPPEQRPDGVFQYAYMDGTSMATPHVAGVAALLMAAKPDAPTTDIIQVLRETAEHPDGSERRPDNRWGWGLIQPVEALKALN